MRKDNWTYRGVLPKKVSWLDHIPSATTYLPFLFAQRFIRSKYFGNEPKPLLVTDNYLKDDEVPHLQFRLYHQGVEDPELNVSKNSLKVSGS